MQVTALVPAEHHVCTRYRAAQFMARLRAAGVDLQVEALRPTWFERVRQLTRRRRHALVVRKLLPEWQFALLRRSTAWLGYDFDDAVFYRDSFRGGAHDGSATRRRRFAFARRIVDRVFAGNRFLAAEAARRGAYGKVDIAPTCVDADQYRPHGAAGRRMVWIGASRTVHYLESAAPVFAAIAAAAPGLPLRVVADRFPTLPGVPVEPVRWTAAGEAAALAECGIGIAPLADDAWSRGKCGLKVLQYMAAGLAVVASPVGVQRELLADGAGILAETPAEWAAAVAALANDPARRAALGAAARRRVEERYSVAAWAPTLAARFAEARRCA